MLFSAPTAFLAVVAAVYAQSTVMNVSVSFDTTYDNPGGNTSTVTCSNGPNGLASKFPNFTAIPSFPDIGGAGVISFDSPTCGTCWELKFNGSSVNVTLIDSAAVGTFNIAQAAMDKLTNNNAVFLGRVNATAQMVGLDSCEPTTSGRKHVGGGH